MGTVPNVYATNGVIAGQTNMAINTVPAQPSADPQAQASAAIIAFGNEIGQAIQGKISQTQLTQDASQLNATVAAYAKTPEALNNELWNWGSGNLAADQVTNTLADIDTYLKGQTPQQAGQTIVAVQNIGKTAKVNDIRIAEATARVSSEYTKVTGQKADLASANFQAVGQNFGVFTDLAGDYKQTIGAVASVIPGGSAFVNAAEQFGAGVEGAGFTPGSGPSGFSANGAAAGATLNGAPSIFGQGSPLLPLALVGLGIVAVVIIVAVATS